MNTTNTCKWIFQTAAVVSIFAAATVVTTKPALATADTFQPGVNVFDNFDRVLPR